MPGGLGWPADEVPLVQHLGRLLQEPRRGTRGRHRVHDPAVRAGRHLAPGGDAQLVERLPVQEPLRRLRHRARRRGGVDAPRRREGADEAALDQPRAAALQEGPTRAARLWSRLLPCQHGCGEERHVGRAGGQVRQAALHRVRHAFLVQGQRGGERRDRATRSASTTPCRSCGGSRSSATSGATCP